MTVRTVSEPVALGIVGRSARTCRRAFRNRNAARRAVAVRGAVCYNMPRCAAMGGKIPATKQETTGQVNHFPVRAMPYASRIVSYHCAGGVFRKRR